MTDSGEDAALRLAAVTRFARYGPSDHYLDPPSAGMCISVFAVVHGSGGVLVGKPRRFEFWASRWMGGWNGYSPEEREAFQDQTMLPCTYLREGEHPGSALERIMHDQLTITNYEAGNPRIDSWQANSDWYPSSLHWDLTFSYKVAAEGPREVPEWWSNLRFRSPEELRAADFGWNGDLAVALGIARD